MDFKFKLDKKPQAPAAPATAAEDAKKIVLTAADVRPLGPKPTTPHKKSDWSEKTASAWREHTSFLDQTKLTGITPPPRFGTVAKIVKPGSIGDKRPTGSPILTALLVLIFLTLLGGGGFYYFGGVKGFTDFASEKPVAKPMTKKIATNPTKNKPMGAAPAAARGLEPIPAVKPGEKPTEISPEKPATAPAGSAPPNASGTSAAPTTGAAAAPAGPTEAVAQNLLPLPEPKPLRPLIRLSTQPSTSSQRAAISRDLALLTLDRDEVANLRKNAIRNPATRAMLDAWRGEMLSKRNAPGYPLTSFKGLTIKDEDYLKAKIDLQQIRELTMAAVVFGEAELAKMLRSRVLAWAKTYAPVGDAVSDAELEPVVEAIASLQSTLPPDERGVVDSWMLLMGDRQITELIDHDKTNDVYFAKHLMMMALIGFTTGNKNIQNYVMAKFPAHISSGILADGSSTTYQTTHSIEKHADHLHAILRVSVLLARAHLNDRETVPSLGSALAKAIDFTYPYVLGRMDHLEFQGSKDPQNPEHGLIPATTLPFLDTLVYFRPSLTGDIALVAGQPRKPSWDPASLYFSSMIRKTDDFEQRMITPSTFRTPATAVRQQPIRGASKARAQKR